MRAIVGKAVADIRRRRLQTGVILVIVMLASGTAALGLTLLVHSSDPYDRAFARQKGAHLQVYVDAARVSRAQLAATGPGLGATAVSTWATTGIDFGHGSFKEHGLNLVARGQPGGPVERLRLVAGRWASAPGEVVLTRSFAQLHGIAVGDGVRAIDLPGKPSLRVVGEAVDIDEGDAQLTTQSAWVSEAGFPSLVPADRGVYQAEYKVAYRLPGDPSDADLQRTVARLKTLLPPDSVTGTLSYTELRNIFNVANASVVGLLLAFGIFALGASAAIVVNLVAGIVLSTYREVGVMKALGFTPAQVVAVHCLHVLLPGMAGSLLGVTAGSIISQPVMQQSARALGLPAEPEASFLVPALTLAAVLAVLVVAATMPALRAGRLNPVRAISLATAPSNRGGVWIRRLLATLVPGPIGLGAGDAFARPLRGLLTTLAVVAGVAGGVFAVGAYGTVDQLSAAATYQGHAQVAVQREAAYPDASVLSTLAAQPETLRVVGAAGLKLAVPGVATPVNGVAFRGDSQRLGYLIISGRWFRRPGEVVVPKAVLQEANLRIGGSFTGSANGREIPLTIVGEAYDVTNAGRDLFMDWTTYRRFDPAGLPSSYLVALRPGADQAAYMNRVAASEPDFLSVEPVSSSLLGPAQMIVSVIAVLAAVLAVIGAAGVFNTLLLTTREKVRDTAILKALGMTPAQVVVMVVSSALVITLAGSLAGVPLGIAVHHVLISSFQAFLGNDAPPQTLDVFRPVELVGVPLAALLAAAAAAALPGGLAARTAAAQVLRSE